MGLKLKYRLPPGWKKVEDWQNKLDGSPDDLLPGSPHRTAILLNNAATGAMMFIVPLRLPGGVALAHHMLKIVARGNKDQGRLVSPIETDASGGEFSHVSSDGMSAGRIVIKKIAADLPICVVTIGLWPTDNEDGAQADFELIRSSLTLV